MQLKKANAIEHRVKKQILDRNQKSITNLFSKDFLQQEAIYGLSKIKKIEQGINIDDLIYKT